MKRFLLIDLNSVGFAAQNTQKLTAGDMEVQAIFHSLNTIRVTLERFPHHKPIGLWDGKAKWRFELFPGYKDRSGKDKESDRKRAEYKRQRSFIAKALMLLGITQIVESNSEADDLAAQLSEAYSSKGDEVILVTGDKDWLQLVNENVSWYEHRNNEHIDMSTFYDKTGFKFPEQFVEGKALTGDSSDTIPGIGGIGEKGAPVFIAEHGSVKEFMRKYLSGELPKKLPAAYKRIAENTAPPPSKKYGEMAPAREAYVRNKKLMDLTKAPFALSSMTVKHGTFDEEGFRDFCEGFAFMSIIRKFDDWIKAFKERDYD